MLPSPFSLFTKSKINTQIPAGATEMRPEALKASCFSTGNYSGVRHALCIAVLVRTVTTSLCAYVSISEAILLWISSDLNILASGIEQR
jgi:hypothetical protein